MRSRVVQEEGAKPYQLLSSSHINQLSGSECVPRQCPCCYRPGAPFCDDCDPKGSADRLQGLRALLKAHGLDAYIVTSEAWDQKSNLVR